MTTSRYSTARMSRQALSPYLITICLVAACGGLLFGYDWVVIGGAKPFYEVYFNVESPSLSGWLMSTALVGCIIGAMFSGLVADRYGRKPSLMLAAFLFLVSAVGTAYSYSVEAFVVYRVIGGLGIGIASGLSPMYIAEVSPARVRGGLVAVNQLTIVVGVLAAQLANLYIAQPVNGAEVSLESWNVQEGWRWMFGAEAIPAGIFLILTLIIPESPRWLLQRDRIERAKEVLNKLGEADYTSDAIQEVKAANQLEKSSFKWRDLGDSKFKPVLFIGIVLAVFQQWSGINVVFNYAQEIFASAGYDVDDTLKMIVATGSVNLVFTLLALPLIDRWGRRSLMLVGAILLSIIYLLLGGSYFLDIEGISVMILVLAAVSVYAVTLAPVTWVLLSEIFPTQIRAKAVAVGVFSLWTACFALTYTFPWLNHFLGAAGTFWLYGLICLLGFFFILQRVPETKGRTLEEIEREIMGEQHGAMSDSDNKPSYKLGG